MEVAACLCRIGEHGELLDRGDDVGEDDAEDGELREESVGNGDTVDYAGAAVVTDEDGLDG